MKALLSAVLLIAVSAWGQSKPTVAPCLHGDIKVSGPVKLINCLPPKPHKPKPSVAPRPSMCHMGGDLYVDGKLSLRGEDFNFNGVPLCENHSTTDPCDGFACTKPVEMLPQKKEHPCTRASIVGSDGDCGEFRNEMLDEQVVRVMTAEEVNAYLKKYCPNAIGADMGCVLPNGDGIQDIGTLGTADCKDPGADEGCGVYQGWQPDKAAVPSPVPNIVREPPWEKECDAKRNIHPDWDGDNSPEVDRAETFITSETTVTRLNGCEYSHLQSLRTSVVEEEKRLAVKYGARPEVRCTPIKDLWGTRCLDTESRPADHYEYKGQFLLIDKGGKL